MYPMDYYHFKCLWSSFLSQSHSLEKTFKGPTIPLNTFFLFWFQWRMGHILWGPVEEDSLVQYFSNVGGFLGSMLQIWCLYLKKQPPSKPQISILDYTLFTIISYGSILHYTNVGPLSPKGIMEQKKKVGFLKKNPESEYRTHTGIWEYQKSPLFGRGGGVSISDPKKNRSKIAKYGLGSSWRFCECSQGTMGLGNT